MGATRCATRCGGCSRLDERPLSHTGWNAAAGCSDLRITCTWNATAKGMSPALQRRWRIWRKHRWSAGRPPTSTSRSEEHTSELQSLMRSSYAVFCLKKKNNKEYNNQKNCTTEKIQN